MTNEELDLKKKELAQKTFSLVAQGNDLLNNLYATAYQKALEYLDEGEYEKALNSAKLLEKSEGYEKTAKLLKIRIYIECNEEITDQTTETLVSLWEDVTNYAESFEDYFAMYDEVVGRLYDWHRARQKEYLLRVENNPSFDEMDNCLSNGRKSHRSVRDLCLSLHEHASILDELEQNSGMTLTDAEEVYYNPTNLYTAGEHYMLYGDCGCRIFEKMKTFLEDNRHGSSEYMEEIGNELLVWVYVIDSLMTGIADCEDISKYRRIAYLKQRAAAWDYFLTERIYPNGVEISLNWRYESRVQCLEKLKTVYEDIRKLDPSFIVPKLPDAQPITAANNSTAQNSSGCYVATCVYGSYDCPQVWTLRRFRDNTLAETWWGRAFIRTYYAISPTLVKWFGHTEWFKKMWQGKLDRMVAKLQANGIESTPYDDKVW